MRKKNFKGRCEKITVTKSKSICKTYDDLQRSYLEKLEANSDIQEIRMNIVLDSLPDYMSDFVSDVYTMMLKEKYCDETGHLKEDHPSIHQFRYYFQKTKKLQNLYISRGGLKDYQKNHRPLLGDGVQEFAPNVGFGMLDSTICDIYLVNDAGEVVGRPILTA